MPVDPVEIERCRACGGKHHRGFRIDRDAGPGIRAADQLVSLARPRVVPELPGLRNGVKNPAQLAVVHVERADVSGRTGQRFGNAAADDHQIFEDGGGAARAYAGAFGRHAQALTQIDAAVVAERSDRLSRPCIQGVEVVPIGNEDAVLVHRDAAVAESSARRGAATGIEGPPFAAGFRVQRHHLHRRRRRVEHAVDDDRVALHF